MIIYLHGFGSTGNSAKVDALRKRFGVEQVIAPNLPFDPNKVIAVVDDIVKDFYSNPQRKEPLIFVGTSLGGFYANYFGHRYDCPMVLVNPSVCPDQTLRDRLGINKNYATGEEFLVNIAHLQELETMKDYIAKNYAGILVNLFVAKDDEVIPYNIALEVFKYTNGTVVTEDGRHRFDKNWDMVIDKIGEILKN